MEALIARMRLLILIVNTTALVFFLDTSGMNMTGVWWLMGISFAVAIPVVVLEPYRRWRVFQASLATAAFDSFTIAVFIALTGASGSPFFPLYYLSVAAIAMRFDLRQSIVIGLLYAFMYAGVYIWTWEGTRADFGVLAVRSAYMMFIAIGVGHLAREENTRARQVDEIERLHAANQKLQSRQERAARIDKLTGCTNRAYFEKDAAKEIRRTRAAGGYLSVLFCDMDHLKRINDELGHDVGDKVLRSVGVAMKHRLRGQDLIGRYGGDEFVVVLPNVTRETAYDRADQLIEGVRSVNAGLPEDLHIGLSVGIATFPFDAHDYPTLVRVADQAMYLAKREGGNRTRTANDLRLFWEDMPATA